MNRVATRTHAEAVLRRQFNRAPHDFIALHDVGPPASARLLAALGGAALRHVDIGADDGSPAVAALPCVDLAGPLRIYGSPVDASPSALEGLAAELLGCSRLGVLMIGDPAPAALERTLQSLRELMSGGQWHPNRALLLLPLTSTPSLAAQAAALAQHGGIEVRVTPPASKPDDAWRYIVGAWNRLRQRTDSATTTTTIRLCDMPQPPPAPRPLDGMRDEAWRGWLASSRTISGVLHACVFDRSSGAVLAHHGESRTADRLASQGAVLAAAIASVGAALGLDTAGTDAAITLGGHHLLLAALPGHPGLAVHLMLDARQSNPTLARLQFARMLAAAPAR